MFSLFLCTSPAFAQFGIFEKTADWGTSDYPPQRGSYKVPGSVEVTGSGDSAVYLMKGNGDDIWESNDEGFYVYKELAGSWRLSGKVYWEDPGGVGEWAKIGVMIREEADNPLSRHYWIELRSYDMGDRTDAQWRTSTGSDSANVQIFNAEGNDISDPGEGLWLRVSRFASIDLVMTEYSLDGSEWNFAHSMTMQLPETVAYGLTITNHEDNEYLAEATVSEVKLEEAPPIVTANRSFDAPGFQPGDSIGVAIQAVNGGDAALQWTIADTVPEGWEISDVSGNGVVDGQTITWDLAFDPGFSNLTYKVKAPASFDPYTEGYGALWSGTVGPLPLGGTGGMFLMLDGVGMFEGSAEVVPYQHATRGNTHAEGWVELTDDVYEIGGNGWDIQEGEDEFFYLFNRISGGFRIEATVEYGAQQPHEWSKVGLMARETLDPGSPRFMVIYRGNQDIVESGDRESQNGGWVGTSVTLPSSMQLQPVRIAFSRFASTNTFVSEYFNTDMDEWVTIRTTTIPMPVEILWGLASTSHVDDDSSWAVALFSDIFVRTVPFSAARDFSAETVTPGGSITISISVNVEPGVTSDFKVTENYPASMGKVSNVSASAGTPTDDGNGTIAWEATGAAGTQTLTYTFTLNADAEGETVFSAGTAEDGKGYSVSIPAAIVLLFDFMSPDLGIFDGGVDIGTDPGGGIGRSGDDFAVVGLGHDIWDQSDDFFFLYKKVEGNFKLSIDNVSIGPTGANPSGNDWQKMGIMARQDLNGPSAYAIACLRSSDQAFMMQWRETAGGDGNWDGDSTLTTFSDHGGISIILEREGDTFYASYVDASGEEILNNAHDVIMEDPIYVGVAVTSHQIGATSAGNFSNPQFEGTAVPVRRWILY